MIEAHIPQLSPPGPNAREHWSVRHRRVKRERKAVGVALLRHRRPRLPVVVTLTRRAPRALDDDNAIGSMKAVRDAVAAWLRVDDRDTRVTWHVEQAKCHRSETETVIVVEARP